MDLLHFRPQQSFELETFCGGGGFSLLARIWGYCSTNHSPPALFSFFPPFLKWRLAKKLLGMRYKIYVLRVQFFSHNTQINFVQILTAYLQKILDPWASPITAWPYTKTNINKNDING